MKCASCGTRSLAALLVAVLLIVTTPANASAIDITKSYNFGPGTGSHTTTSAAREFNIPCGTPGSITVTMSIRRLGPTDQSHDFSIDIEVREPASGQQTQGPITAGGALGATVWPTSRSITVTAQPTAGGCSRPWVVRLKGRNGEEPRYAVEGAITLRYSGATRDLGVSTMSSPYLKIGESMTVSIASAAGCGQGRMVITGNWNHTIGIVPGPLPVKLRFQLMNDSFGLGGVVLAEAEGYSNNELRGELSKLRLVHQIPDCRTGQWKLRITNIDAHDAFLNTPSVKMTPTCP